MCFRKRSKTDAVEQDALQLAQSSYSVTISQVMPFPTEPVAKDNAEKDVKSRLCVRCMNAEGDVKLRLCVSCMNAEGDVKSRLCMSCMNAETYVKSRLSV